jgi:putative membrane protein
MNAAPLTPHRRPGSLLCAGALLAGLASAQVLAQDGSRAGAADTRLDQFVTTQEGASGFGGRVPDDERAMQLDDADRAFLVEAHQVEMMQVHAAVVAQKKKRTTQAVKSHARRVLDAHQASLVAIEKIGRDHGLELERRFSPDFQRRAQALRAARGPAFASVFFGQMLELHDRQVASFERAASRTDNADLRTLVEDSLPTLRTQLADAEQFSTTLGTVAAH